MTAWMIGIAEFGCDMTHMDDNHQNLSAVWAGALAGGLVSFIVNWLFSIVLPWCRRFRLTRNISIIGELPQDGLLRCRVINGGQWTINDATLYVDLDCKLEDTLPANGRAFIGREHFVPLSGDQLCWSVRSPKPNPMRVSLFAKERQAFILCHIGKEFITIPSEEGWSNPNGTVRVFLHPQRYTGRLKLVSADTDARYFSFVIDPDLADKPCAIEPICGDDQDF